MNNYEIYVKTSAIGQTGIHWRHIKSDNDHPIQAPPFLQYPVFKHQDGFSVGINDLIDEVSPSLLIFKNNEKIMLEVSGIESPERSRRMGRKVFNLVAWITDNNQEGDLFIRKIACDVVQYLLGEQNKIQNLINNAIDFYESEEFRVNPKLVEQYINDLDEVENRSNQTILQDIALGSEGKLKELAGILKTFSLPIEWETYDYMGNTNTTKSEGVVVVVTDRLEQDDLLYYAGVWRGFASNVKEPEVINEVQCVPQLQNNENITPQRQEEESKLRKKLVLAVLVVVVIFLIGLIIIYPVFIMKNYQQELPQPVHINKK
jgi:hypothetical protein